MTKRPDAKLDLLARHPLTAGCTSREITAMGRQAELIEVADGTVLVHAGGLARWIYLIVDGTVQFRDQGRIVETRQAGSEVGAAAALARRPHAETVAATGPVTAFSIPTRAVAVLAETCPKVAANLLSALSARVVELERSAVRHRIATAPAVNC